MAKYRVIRVKEEIYIKIKEFQLELIKKGGTTPSMGKVLEILIGKGRPGE